MTKEESIATCERIFAKHLGGHALMSNANHIRGSAWINFPRVLCERWSHKNIVLMGDAAATAHFSIGSGTKLALESAIAMADYPAHRARPRRPPSPNTRTRAGSRCCGCSRPARNSLEWFEEVGALSRISIRCSSTIRC